MMATPGSGKVSFAIGNKKPKKKTNQKSELSSEDFGNEERPNDTITTEHENNPREPLVIPLTKTQQGSLLERKRIVELSAEDEAAKSALVREAISDAANKSMKQQSTDFTGSGKLVIPTTTTSSAPPTGNQTDTDERLQLQSDLKELPTELDPSRDDETYRQVPVHQFGAALLRGMGWKGDEASGISSDTKDAIRRPHRLGLGATPKPSGGDRERNNRSLSGMIRTPNQVDRERRLREQQQEFEQQRRELLLKDKQQVLQRGSIVRVNGVGRGSGRAKMVQLIGVPGLNRVKVQLEGESKTTVVPKSSVSLIKREQLDESKTFHDVPLQEAKADVTKFHGENRRSVARDSMRADTGRDNDKPSQRGRDEGVDRKRNLDDRIKGRSKRRRKEEEEYEDRKAKKKKRRKQELSQERSFHPTSPQHWIVPNIRVRVVTKKLGTRYFKEKGIVLDVAKRGESTLQMSDGSLLDRVAERHLETALPKPGGKAVVLATGEHKFRRGTLLERNSERCVVQMHEDMSVLTLPLDDIAEWMGPLEEQC